MMYFIQQGLGKLNDTLTKMYFNQQGLQKLNDTTTKMYFSEQGLEKLNDTSFQPTGFGEVKWTSTKLFQATGFD